MNIKIRKLLLLLCLMKRIQIMYGTDLHICGLTRLDSGNDILEHKTVFRCCTTVSGSL